MSCGLAVCAMVVLMLGIAEIWSPSIGAAWGGGRLCVAQWAFGNATKFGHAGDEIRRASRHTADGSTRDFGGYVEREGGMLPVPVGSEGYVTARWCVVWPAPLKGTRARCMFGGTPTRPL